MAQTLIGRLSQWFGFGGSRSIAPKIGEQTPIPGAPIVSNTSMVGFDGAMQLSTVWACIERRANTMASLPMFVYDVDATGEKKISRDSTLYYLLKESPNARMTPYEFWRAMQLNYDLRGNSYAVIERNGAQEAVALWPLMADYTKHFVDDRGVMTYTYKPENAKEEAFPEKDILHIRGLGNGVSGLRRLDFMRASTNEMAKAQQTAANIFGNDGKTSAVLSVKTQGEQLTTQQVNNLQQKFSPLVNGGESRLYILDADLYKIEKMGISPEDQQLMEARNFQGEEICRWLDVPPVLVHHKSGSAWGNDIEQIIDGFIKFSLRPMCIAIEQAIRKRVMTDKQRLTQVAEFEMDALLRGSAMQRSQIYATYLQNGVMTRNEARKKDNWPRSQEPGADSLTVQSNLLPIGMLGQTTNFQGGKTNANVQDVVKQ